MVRGIECVNGKEAGACCEESLGNAEGIVDLAGNVADQRTLLVDNGLVQFSLKIANCDYRHKYGEQNHQRRNGNCHSLFEVHYPDPRGVAEAWQNALTPAILPLPGSISAYNY